MNKDTENIIALTMVPGLGAKSILRLIEGTSGTEEVFRLSDEKLSGIMGKKTFVSSVLSSVRRSKGFIDELLYITDTGIKAVSILDEEYPESLKNIYDPPPVLFVKGVIEGINKCSVAVVGSRSCSFYGMNMSERLSYSLAEKDITIVSGMARGIDAAAHKGALKADGRTIAVLGSGFKNIYPPESVPLMGEICRKGAVLTEYTSNIEPLRYNFPNRNRIISGLCEGVVVVEAGYRSGAMITANIALDQGREVFAVPGRVDTASSKGTNYLIQNGAKLVMGPDDITEELGSYQKQDTPGENVIREKKEKKKEKKFETEPENKVFDILSGENICLHIDDILEKSDMRFPELAEVLLKMECSGAISALAGRRFVVKRN